MPTTTIRIEVEAVEEFRWHFASVHALTVGEVGVHGAVHVDDSGLVTVRSDHGGHWVAKVADWHFGSSDTEEYRLSFAVAAE